MTWIPVTDAWTGVTQHSAAYHAGLQRLVVLGGLGDAGMRDQIWQRDPTKYDAIDGGWRDVTNAFSSTERPPARYGAAMAYDPVRDVIVLFGGVMSTTTTVRLGDTWEYATSGTTVDGERVGIWRKVTTSMAPTARELASMAFDATLGKIVLFGGFDGLVSSETWTYDGTWTKLAPATSPLGRSRAAMAYDGTRGKLVMYGGRADGKTWEFDGATWTSVTLTTNPGTRNEASLVYDPVRAKLVLFGGTTTGGVGQDTWTYDGTWQQVGAAIAPYGRRSAQLVSETGFERLVLVGGTGTGTVGFDDVWELDANGWSAATPRFTPPRAVSAAHVYSPADGALLRVGGATGGGAAFETWLFDGVTWVHGTDAPIDRYWQGLAYDSMRDRFVMASGSCVSDQPACDPSTYTSRETHVLDRASQTWSPLASAMIPAGEAREAFAMIYDAVHDEIIGFGGRVNLTRETFTNTLVFDGTAWSTRVTTKHPAATVSPAATWDPVRGEIVLFDSAGVTWVYRDREWIDIIGADPDRPGRSTGRMAYDPFRDRFLLMGGDTAGGVTLDDVWELDPVVQKWTRLFISGVGPLPRRDFVFSMLPRARAMVLNGGRLGAAGASDETWLLKFVSTTPDETCTNGDDDDGDAQVDADDPDCDPPPP